MFKKTAVMLCVLVALFAACVVPVSAASNTDYYDSADVYATEYVKRSGFAFTDYIQLEGVPYKEYEQYYEWNYDTLPSMTFPAIHEWKTYEIFVPTDAITVNPGDEYLLDFEFEFYSSLPLFWGGDGAIYSGIGLCYYNGYVEGVTQNTVIVPSPDVEVDEWPSYGSLKRHRVHIRSHIKSSQTVTLKDISFRFELYRSRTDAPYFRVYKSSKYKLFGGSRYLIEQMKEFSDLNEGVDNLNDKQQQTNDKLDELIAQPEQEKAEGNSAGQDAVDQLTAIIPSDNQGVMNAFGGLVESMSYSGTNCQWTFPAMYLPEVKGVMGRIQLTDEKPIVFTDWVDAIPSDIMEVVRIVCTVALVLFCFKELYGVIMYVLTMKGGGD